MAYDNLCMYCFEDMEGQTACPHCGRDSRAAVPQIQMLPGSLVYHDRFLIGRALGQDASGIVYAAFDTKKENRLRIREYLPRDCAERLNDGAVVPIAGMEDQFEAGIRKLRASVESVEDPRKRHFFFEENGTAYIAQRKSAVAASAQDQEEEPEEERRRSRWWALLYVGIAMTAVVAAGLFLLPMLSGGLQSTRDITQSPTLDPNEVWIPAATPTATPYVAPTFAALVDPELSWMEYTYEGDVEQEYQRAQSAAATPSPTPSVRPEATVRYSEVNGGSDKAEIRRLQQRLVDLGWLDEDGVTGKYDADTRQALRSFQRYAKLSADGVAGPKTLRRLYESEIYRPTPSPTPRVTPRADEDTVNEKSPASRVRRVQQQLIALGLLPESAEDGNYGATTAAAVRRFQKRVNELLGYEALEVSGRVDPQTMAYLDDYAEEWERLRLATAEPTPTPRPTAEPTATPTNRPVEAFDGVINADSPAESVRKVQQLLVAIGMLPGGGADGVYGSATLSAVADFQQWVNLQRGEQTLPVNGEVDQLTLAYLQYCKDHALAPNATPVPTPAPTATPTAAPTEPPIDVPLEPEPDQPEGSQEITVGPKSDRESIRYVQEMLSAVGAMNASGVDGVYGNGTTRAVRRFQTWVNQVQGKQLLEVTGQVDNRTRLALEYAYDHELRVEVPEEETPTEAPEEIPTAAPADGLSQELGEAPEDAAEPEPEIPEESQQIQIGPESDPESIRFVQEMLVSVGLLESGDMNGVYDATTASAVRSFQAWVNRVRGETLLSENGQVDDRTRQALEYAFDHDLSVNQGGQESGVGSVTAPSIVIAGASAGNGPVSVEGDTVQIGWGSSGDVYRYYVRFTDADGHDMTEPQTTDHTSVSLPVSAMQEGMVYTVIVGAIPVGGGEADMQVSRAQFVRPERIEEELTPEPTEVPTPAPQVAAIGRPVINVGGSAYQQDGISYMTGDSIIISWSADGDVESYMVYVESETGESQELGPTTDTSRTVSAQSLPAGIYTVRVGALPRGGDRSDVQWNTTQFAIPAPATPDGDSIDQMLGYEESGTASFSGSIDANTDSGMIHQMQLKLYSAGKLPDGAEAGVLDVATLQGVAEFQREMNEKRGMDLPIIDPNDPEAVVDAETVRAIFAG